MAAMFREREEYVNPRGTGRIDSKASMRLSKWVSRILAAGLVASHGWLLVTQWLDGRLTEPALLLRWAAAIAITLSLRAIYRSGVPALSRTSVVIWLLAALLHGPAIASRTGATVDFNALPEAAVSLTLQAAAVAGALSLTLLVLASLLRRHRPAAPEVWRFVTSLGGFTPLSDGFSAVVSARPPPAQL